MRFLLSLLLLAGPALAVEPYVGVGAFQPLSSEMHGIYRLMPGACLGVRLPRTGALAFRVGADGYYGSGGGEYSQLRLVSAMLELGIELRTTSALGAYVVPAIVAGYGAERTPAYDSMTGAIYDRWDSGTSLGFGINGGAVLYRAGALRLDAEVGFRLLSVPTDRPQSEYWYSYYPALEVSTFGVGLVARFGSHEVVPGGE